MKRSAKRNTGTWITILFAIGALIALNLISLKKFARLDLTASRAYTLSDATKNVLQGLTDIVVIKAYFTQDLPAPYSTNERYLQDLLSDYSAYADGKLRYEFVAPGDDEELKNRLQSEGIPQVPITTFEKDQFGVKQGYMGLTIEYRAEREVMPVIQDVSNLEYELTRSILALSNPVKKKIGILSGHGAPNMFQELQPLYQELDKLYDVRQATFNGADLNEEFDVLVVPGFTEPLSELELYGLDQFVMRGGRAILLVQRVLPNLQNFQGQPVSTGVDKLAAHYGIEVKENLIKDAQAQTVRMQQNVGGFQMMTMRPYPFIPLITDLDRDSIITRDLQQLSLPFVSEIAVDQAIVDEHNLEVNILARTSEASWLQEGFFFLDPNRIIQPEDESKLHAYPVAATVGGALPSYFAGKEIPTPQPDPNNPEAELPAMPNPADQLDQSAETYLVVVGNAQFARQQNMDAWNATFLINAIDWLSAETELIQMRNRQLAAAPLAEISDTHRNSLKWGNMVGLPVLVILVGFLRYQLAQARRRRIAAQWQAEQAA